jgi:hypothetical protein
VVSFASQAIVEGVEKKKRRRIINQNIGPRVGI